MRAWQTSPWVAVLATCALVVGCSSGPPGTTGAAGTSGEGGTTGGAGGGSGTTGAGGTSSSSDAGAGLSCADACAKVLRLCPDYGSVWADACTSACHNKQIVKPELAKTETDCVKATEDCTTATICVSDIPASTDARPDVSDAGSAGDRPDGAPDTGAADATTDRSADVPTDRPATDAVASDGPDAPASADAGMDAPIEVPPPMGQLIAEGNTSRAPRVLAFSPDGDRLLYTTNTVSGYPTGDLWSWSFSAGKATHIEDRVRGDTVAFDSTGGRLAYLADLQAAGLVGDMGELKVYDFATASTVTLTTLTAGSAVKISPDHARLTYLDGYDSVLLVNQVPLKVWTFAAGSAQQLEATGGRVRAFSPDGQQIAYFAGATGLYVWDVRQNAKATASTDGYENGPVAWSAQSDKLGFMIPQKVQVYDVTAKTIVSAPFSAPTLDQLTFSPDGARLTFRASSNGTTPMLSLMLTATGAATSLGPGNFGAFSPDGALLPIFVPTVGGKPTLHFRTVASGADQTIAANISGQSVRWSDDGKQSLFVTNDGSTSATATLNLWTVSTGSVRALTAASTGLVQNFATFVAGGTRVVYTALAPPGGTLKTGTLADLYVMDLGSSAAVRVAESIASVIDVTSTAYATADGRCAVMLPGYDTKLYTANIGAFPLTGTLPTGGTILDHGANSYPIAVSAKRGAYVIGSGLYVSALPCSP